MRRTYQPDIDCDGCGGSGLVDAEPAWSDLPVHDWQTCPTCDGKGFLEAPTDDDAYDREGNR